MPKFFVSDNQIIDKKITIVGEDVNHIINVLRLQKGNEILVCNKDMNISYNTEIMDISKEVVICQIINEIKEKIESKIDVTIFQGLPKADKMEYIIQKSTELGVKNIVPVAMKRCVVKLDKKDELKKIARWQKIAEVAAKQSGRDAIPKLENVQNIKEIIEKINYYDLFLVAYENEKTNNLKTELKKCKLLENLKIGIVIGPEGGLEEQEVDLLQQNGAKIFTLGNRILRTETASLAILSNIMYEFEM